MPRGALTGSRIRDRRVAAGLKQAEVAKAAGISASYLNLIEHNRRRIGGKILAAIARALGCEVSALSEGAEAVLLVTLREAASGAARPTARPAPGPPTQPPERAEEFAGRFPGWAAVLAERQARVEALERAVEALNDRLAHDPHLSTSLHELLTAVTAIRSTTSILAGTEDIDPALARRFLGNLDAEGRRLAEGAELLVRYLDRPGDRQGNGAATVPATPPEEVEAFFAARGWHLAEIEAGATVDAVLEGAAELGSQAGRRLARAAVERYARDARLLPLAALGVHLGQSASVIAARLDAPPQAVLRRLAMLPGREAGLVIADQAGGISFRRPLAGFALPRHGVCCPLWPLFQALTRPAQTVSAVLEMPGEAARRVRAEAIAMPLAAPDFETGPVFETVMLLTPTAEAPGMPVGPTCRICPREACRARREASVFGATADREGL